MMGRLLSFLSWVGHLLAETPVAPYLSPPQNGEIPPLPSPLSGSYGIAFMKMILALIGLILLFILTIWFLKRVGKFRFGGKKASQAIHVLERYPLSQKSILYLVEVDGKRVLLSESQLEVRRLETLDPLSPDLS